MKRLLIPIVVIFLIADFNTSRHWNKKKRKIDLYNSACYVRTPTMGKRQRAEISKRLEETNWRWRNRFATEVLGTTLKRGVEAPSGEVEDTRNFQTLSFVPFSFARHLLRA